MSCLCKVQGGGCVHVPTCPGPSQRVAHLKAETTAPCKGLLLGVQGPQCPGTAHSPGCPSMPPWGLLHDSYEGLGVSPGAHAVQPGPQNMPGFGDGSLKRAKVKWGPQGRPALLTGSSGEEEIRTQTCKGGGRTGHPHARVRPQEEPACPGLCLQPPGLEGRLLGQPSESLLVCPSIF